MSNTSQWIKASKSANDNSCVEMRQHNGGVQLREGERHASAPKVAGAGCSCRQWRARSMRRQIHTLSCLPT